MANTHDEKRFQVNLSTSSYFTWLDSFSSKGYKSTDIPTKLKKEEFVLSGRELHVYIAAKKIMEGAKDAFEYIKKYDLYNERVYFVVRSLLNATSQSSMPVFNYEPLFHTAVFYGKIDFIKTMINSQKVDIRSASK